MIDFNPTRNTLPQGWDRPAPASGASQGPSAFGKAAEKVADAVAHVDQMQQDADASIKDLLAGKNPDVTEVVSEVAKADMSFKLLVGVRNKLIEAYKQTMNMQL